MNAETETLVGDLAPGVVRTARKPWRCVCAVPNLSYGVRATHATGWSQSTFVTLEEATAAKEELERAGRRDRAGVRRAYRSVVVTPWPNPNYRAGCAVEIPVGARYFEYLEGAEPFQAGPRYCARCALAVWHVRCSR